MTPNPEAAALCDAAADRLTPEGASPMTNEELRKLADGGAENVCCGWTAVAALRAPEPEAGGEG